MGGPVTSRPLRVLILAEQRKTLRHISRFLGAMGYEVQQATSAEQALAVMDVALPDFLIVDAEPATAGARDLCRLANPRPAAGHLYTLLMVHEPTLQELGQAIEAGVDDFLTKPIVYAEMLVRLRAGARMLEFERRLCQQSGVDPQTGLPNRHALVERLRRELAQGGEGRSLPACVVADVDFLRHVNLAHGLAAGDRLIGGVIEQLGCHCGSADLLASFGGARFGVLLPERSAAEATAWAEQARAALAEIEVDLGAGTVRPTASFGVAGCEDAATTAEQIVERAVQALQLAKSSGRNCVVTCGQLDGEAAAWADLAAPGKMFERTVARDVMVPCTLLLRPRQTVDQAAVLLRRTGLDEVPVVDTDGRLVGLAAAGMVLDQLCGSKGAASSPSIAEVMSTEVVSYDEQTPLAMLIDFFTRDARSLVVITHDGRPTGLVSTASLASLSEPLTSASFAPDRCHSSTSDYLLVTDPVASATA
jgi:two-component system cell cycle response regulator